MFAQQASNAENFACGYIAESSIFIKLLWLLTFFKLRLIIQPIKKSNLSYILL
jgi:hypothetical protein